MVIVVDIILIENGKVYFVDYLLMFKFVFVIESLNGKVLGIDFCLIFFVNVDIIGKIDNYVLVKLVGIIYLLKDDIDFDLDFLVKGVELILVNFYLGIYMGYYIDKGLLFLVV